MLTKITTDASAYVMGAVIWQAPAVVTDPFYDDWFPVEYRSDNSTEDISLSQLERTAADLVTAYCKRFSELKQYIT